MKKAKIGCLSLVALLALAITGVYVVDTFMPSRAVRLLPDDAEEIKEYYRDYGFTGDFVRQVKAKVKKESLEEYARRTGLLDPPRGETKPSMNFSRGQDWWTPPDDAIYGYEEGTYYVLLGWEDGYLYFEAGAY